MGKRGKSDPFLEEKIFAAIRKRPDSTRKELQKEVSTESPVEYDTLVKRVQRLKEDEKLREGFEITDKALPPDLHQFIILISTQRSEDEKTLFKTAKILGSQQAQKDYLELVKDSPDNEINENNSDYQKRLVAVIKLILKTHIEPFAVHIFMDSCGVLLGGGGWDVALIVRSHRPTEVHRMVRHLKLLDTVKSTSTLEFDYIPAKLTNAAETKP